MSPTDSSRDRRTGDAGVTLVEMLVVLALIGVMAGAVGLGLGLAARGADPRAEADLLAARMRRASEEALLGGAPVALAWTPTGYRFLTLAEGAWAPHPVPILGTPRPLPAGLRLMDATGADSEGSFAVTADDLPADGATLTLGIGAEGTRNPVAVAWDGAGAAVAEPAR